VARLRKRTSIPAVVRALSITSARMDINMILPGGVHDPGEVRPETGRSSEDVDPRDERFRIATYDVRSGFSRSTRRPRVPSGRRRARPGRASFPATERLGGRVHGTGRGGAASRRSRRRIDGSANVARPRATSPSRVRVGIGVM
jgi:hypothetical protein